MSNNNEKQVNNINVLVVLLVCGLPGAGKSRLIQAFVSKENSSSADGAAPSTSGAVVTIEYDAVQETLQNNDDVDNDALYAWRQSRKQALHDLSEHLSNHNNDAKKTNNNHNKTVILDDNFYLRSMRKQVYRVCERSLLNDNSEDDDDIVLKQKKIYFGIVWLDTPVKDCLERNQRRKEARRVPEDMIHRMSERFEPPGEVSSTYPNGPFWEQSVLRLDGGSTTTTNNNNTIDDDNVIQMKTFVKQFYASTADLAIPRPVDPAIEQARLTAAQLETQTCLQQEADRYWRKCVSQTAQLNVKLAARANKVRKHCLQHHQQRGQKLAINISNKKQDWLDMFLAGDDSDEPWLTELEKEDLRSRLLLHGRQ